MATLAVRHHRHYCRWCDYTLWQTKNPNTSAHMRWVLHATLQHPAELEALVEVRVCDKNCAARAQPDEIQHGVKLYGPGAVRMSQVVPLIKTADELFGPEDE